MKSNSNESLLKHGESALFESVVRESATVGSLVEVLRDIDKSMIEIWEGVSDAYGTSCIPKETKDKLRRAFNAIKDVDQKMRAVRHFWAADSRQ
jgi:hypothetical protein